MLPAGVVVSVGLAVAVEDADAGSGHLGSWWWSLGDLQGPRVQLLFTIQLFGCATQKKPPFVEDGII